MTGLGLALQVRGRDTVTPEDFGAAGDGTTDDTIALQAAFASGRHVELRRSQTYLLSGSLTLSAARQRVFGGGKLKRRNQIATTTATSITYGVTTAITVADATGIFAGQSYVVEQAGMFDKAPKVVQSVVGSVVTFTAAITPTLTDGTTHTNFSGTTNVRSSYPTIQITAADCHVEGLEFDGNKSNWSWSTWWSTVAVSVLAGAHRATIERCYLHDLPGEGITSADSHDVRVLHNRLESVNGNAVHWGGADPAILFRGGHVVGNAIKDVNLGYVTYADGVVSGGTNLQSTLATFTAVDTGKTIVVATVSLTIAAVVDAHNVTLSASTSNGSSISFSVDNVGHADGCVCLSQAIQDYLIADNYMENGVYGIGGIDQTDNIDLTIRGNTIRSMRLGVFEGDNPSNTAACNVLFEGNRVYDSVRGFLNQQNSGSSVFPSRWVIRGNLFYNTKLFVQQSRYVVIDGNVFDGAGSITMDMIDIQTGCKYITVTGNIVNSGHAGVNIGGTGTAYITVANNALIGQNLFGVNVFTASLVGNSIRGNTITNDSSASASFEGVRLAGDGFCEGNKIELTKGQAGVRCLNSGTGDIITNNRIRKGAANNTILIPAGTTNANVVQNFLTNAINDSGTGTITTPANVILA